MFSRRSRSLSIRTVSALMSILIACTSCPFPDAPATPSPHVTPAAPYAAVHKKPVPGEVVVQADIPTENWNRGHRGVDLAASPGQEVHASRGGTIHFAGMVAGTPVISVMHSDGIRTTYEPVLATVSKGQRVRRGQVIGHVANPDQTSRQSQGLSWGAKIDSDTYIDPLTLLGNPVIVLKH